jgi:hypothetical protein
MLRQMVYFHACLGSNFAGVFNLLALAAIGPSRVARSGEIGLRL